MCTFPPNTSHSHVTSFYDTLISSTSHLLSNNLYIAAGDFNRASTHSVSLLGLYNIVTFNTRLYSKLDHLFVNCEDTFKARKRAPPSASDHNIICALPLTPRIEGNKVSIAKWLRMGEHIWPTLHSNATPTNRGK